MTFKLLQSIHIYYTIVLYYSNKPHAIYTPNKNMTTISIPITTELNEFIDEQVDLGRASSKAELIRNAIIKYKEDQFIATIQKAKHEIRQGQALTGDLDKLAKGFN